MFAIFLTEAMDPFYEICSSFPTVVFFVFLLFCLMYWGLAVLGLVEIEALDFDLPNDLDADGLTNSVSNLSVMAGVLLKLGLNGVPLVIIVTLISLFGWFISFFLVYLISPFVPGTILEFVFETIVLLGTLYVSSMITATIIKPLRPIFKAADQHVEKTIVGQVAIVRTGRVDKDFGEAVVEDGGAGLIVKVRSFRDEVFERGQKIVLLEYIDADNIYKVISEKEFTSE